MATEVRVEGVGRFRSTGAVPIPASMMHAIARTARPRTALAGAAALLATALVAGSVTGFGATSATVAPRATLVGTLALTDPSSKSADPPVCTKAVAPLDTDGCADVTFTASPTKVLDLGSLSGTDVQAASLRWLVTTTNPTGYRVHMSNAGAAPLLQGSAGSIADMQASPLVPAAVVKDATHFGVAMGDPEADNESAVAYPGSPWVTGAGQQGELFSGVPTTGMVVAERATPQANDRVTATFAVASIASQPPVPGSYAGTVRLVASAL